MLDKSPIITAILVQLQQQLATALQAAETATATATHKETVAENKYDTFGLEASYLAQGQKQRVFQLEQDLQQFQRLLAQQQRLLLKPSPKTEVHGDKVVSLNSLVEIESDDGSSRWLLLAAAAGGLQLPLPAEIQKQLNISPEYSAGLMLITPQSPLAQALLGKNLDDEAILNINQQQHLFYINQIF